MFKKTTSTPALILKSKLPHSWSEHSKSRATLKKYSGDYILKCPDSELLRISTLEEDSTTIGEWGLYIYL